MKTSKTLLASATSFLWQESYIEHAKRKIYLTAVLLALLFNAQAQDPNMYQHWYLYEIHLEQEPPIYISGYNPYGDPSYPQIHPELIIAQDLSFNGYGVCNSFEGQWELEDDIFLSVAFSETGQGCGLYEDVLEGHYFSLFQEELYVVITVNDLGDGLFELWIGGGPFTSLRFFSEPILGLNDVAQIEFGLSPNPGKDLVQISTDDEWDRLRVYSSNGRIVAQFDNSTTAINLTDLASGIYFIELQSGSARSVQRWIKQ